MRAVEVRELALVGGLNGDAGVANSHILAPDVSQLDGHEDVDVVNNCGTVVGPAEGVVSKLIVRNAGTGS